MKPGRPIDDELVRLWIVFAGMIVFLFLLGSFLWRVQVARGDEFRDSQVKQSMRRVRLPGVRGRMFDRQGKCVADNRPSYNVALYLEELRQPGSWSQTITRVEKLVEDVSTTIRRPVELQRDDIRAHVRKRLPLPLLAWRDLDDSALARLTERMGGRPGIDITTEPVRFYPYGRTAAHVLGYVGRANPAAEAAEEDEEYHYFLPEMEGKSGLENVLDRQLRGVAGGRVLRVDVSGYRRDDMGQQEAKPGSDIQLAIDVKIQKVVEDALGAVPGAAVIVDPRNGDVIALASSPGFDPNAFIPSISSRDWDALASNEDKPLLNRAISEHYAPGSTFKPVTLMAALGSGRLHAETVFNCPGHFDLGRNVFRCWYHAGHGDLALTESLQYSCNVYLFHSGLLCGAQPIHDLAAELGLGRKTRVGLDGEAAGILPDDAWKRRVQNDGWRDGDTCNFSIGQGALSVTPLQMAVLTAAIANGGDVYRPRLVTGTKAPGEREFTKLPPELVHHVGWSLNHLNLIRKGMYDVVMSPTGTGRQSRSPGVQMAGKTGTAEFGPKESRKRHAWMIAFAPFAEPRYAVAMVVDEGVSGGETIAPRLRQVMAALFPQDADASGGQG